MYQTNPTEVWREHHLALLREADERRLARRLRRPRLRRSSQTGSQQRTAALGRVIASWGRTNVPFFRA
jgi:hypothetical protein